MNLMLLIGVLGMFETGLTQRSTSKPQSSGSHIDSSLSVLPDEDKFQKTYHGEGVNCEGTSANIEVDSNTVIESEEGVVIAVEQAVTLALTAIKSNPTTASVVQEALDASQTVLEVVANAIATVTAEINSPNPGCWAIAFGKAQAAAIAKATVHAIVTGFQEALVATGGSVQTFGLATDIQTDVEVVIEEIALLLADGSGGGPKSHQAEVQATARVMTLDCTLAQAFASIANGVSEAEVTEQSGCLIPDILTVVAKGTDLIGCWCIDQNSQGAPNNCGQWGGKQDYICYVQDPSACPCAVPSSIYSNMAWRYCGETLQELKYWLSFEDKKNEIVSKYSEYGYCGELNYSYDKISQISQSLNTTSASVFDLVLDPTQNGGSILSP